MADKIARDLRAALLAEDHDRAGALAAEYAGAIGAAWNRLSDSQRGASEMPKHALELLAWSRDLALIRRALLSEHLTMLEKIVHYQREQLSENTGSAIQVQG